MCLRLENIIWVVFALIRQDFHLCVQAEVCVQHDTPKHAAAGSLDQGSPPPPLGQLGQRGRAMGGGVPGGSTSVFSEK